MESSVDDEICKEIITAIIGLSGTIIGYCGAVYQSNKAFDREKRLLFIKEKKAVYVEALEFIQDYQLKHSNGKKTTISDEDISHKITVLLARLSIYASDNVKNTFWKCKKNIRNGNTDKEFTKLAEAIKKDLELE